jgi:acetyl esterase
MERGGLIYFALVRPILLALVFLVMAAAVTPALDNKGVEYTRPNGKPLLLDLHVPDGNGPFAAAILVHGGGFDEGSRDVYITPLFPVLTNAQFAWFTIDYRLAPEAHLAQSVEDVRAAIAWVHAHAKEYKVNTKKIALIGESAGGFLVNYVGTRKDPDVAAVVDFYGPSDYAKLAQAREAHPELFNMKAAQKHLAHGGGIRFFGVEKLDSEGVGTLRKQSPIVSVHKGMPPFLCIHGNKDDQVLYQQTPEFCDAIRRTGSTCEMITVEGGGHGMSSWKGPNQQNWKPEMVQWLRKTLRVANAS